MADVVGLLLQEHANLAKLLDAVERQLAVFEEGESPDYDIVQGVLDYCLNYPDLYHHPKEDLVFERLRVRDPAAAEALGDLQAEHRRLGALTRRFAAAVRNLLQDLEIPREAFDQVAREFLDHYRRHMDMEERVFLPAAVRSLTAEDWAEIDAQVTAREDPVFGTPQGEERFEALREKVLAWAREGG
ncbi:MAG: hemerythrin domain-containing protein [Kiloniellaceae bacterium]